MLTSASLMMGAPATWDAVKRAQSLKTLRVGLHLVLTDGWAVLSPRLIPDLVGLDGRFDNHMLRDGVRFAALPRVRRQLEAEIRAQFDAFAQSGLTLDHVNVHKHFHVHPVLLDLILRIGGEFGMPAVRVPYEPLRFARRQGGVAAVASVAFLAPWTAMMKRRLQARGVGYNDQVFGISRSGAMDVETLLAILRELPEGFTEIYLHPATRSGAAIAPSMAGYQHQRELAALMNPSVMAALEASGAKCGGFRDLLPVRLAHAA